METVSPGGLTLKIGVVMRPHGLRGAFVVKPFSPGPPPVFLERIQLLLPWVPEPVECRVKAWKKASNGSWIVESPDFTLDRAQSIRNAQVQARAADYPPPAENEIWLEALMGATATWPDGTVRGTVIAVLESPAPYPVLVLKTPQNTETYLPLPQEHFVSFDETTRVLVVSTPEPAMGP